MISVSIHRVSVPSVTTLIEILDHGIFTLGAFAKRRVYRAPICTGCSSRMAALSDTCNGSAYGALTH